MLYAEKIAKIDSLVRSSDSAEITAGWTSLIACLDKESCTDEFYMFLKIILARGKTPVGYFWAKKDNTAEQLLGNLLDLKLAAEKNNIVLRSKLVSDTNSLIITQSSIEAKDLWEDLVNCNFSCNELDELLLVVTESYFER